MKYLVFLLLTIWALSSCEQKENEKPEITGITPLEDIEVTYGKTPEIPTKAEVKFSDGSTQWVYIKWNNYINPLQAGEYSLNGTLLATKETESLQNETIQVNVKITDVPAGKSEKWSRVFLYNSFSEEDEFMGVAIERDSMNIYEKAIENLGYFSKVITSKEEYNHLKKYLKNNCSINIADFDFKEGTIGIYYMFQYNYKTLIGDTVTPKYNATAQGLIKKGVKLNKFYGDKYVCEGTLQKVFASFNIIEPTGANLEAEVFKYSDLLDNMEYSISLPINGSYKSINNFTLGWVDDFFWDTSNALSVKAKYQLLKAKLISTDISSYEENPDQFYFLRTKYKKY